jgi:hypothetical protein
METKLTITRDELSRLCWAFHKWFRVADVKGSSEMWEAIHNLDDKDYPLAMNDALGEIGIEVNGEI